MKSFHIVEVRPDKIIIGRNDDSDIPAGHTFTKIVKGTIQGKYPNYEPTLYEDLCLINLTLKKVHFYGKEVDVIPGGHTAGLVVEGDLYILRHALADLNENEYLHIK